MLSGVLFSGELPQKAATCMDAGADDFHSVSAVRLWVNDLGLCASVSPSIQWER